MSYDMTYLTEEITAAHGTRFKIELSYDDYFREPWKENDGHGEVSDWTTRDKRAGELVLWQDGRSKLFYDFAGAVKTARADGWGSRDCAPDDTPGQRAHKAAMSDYNYLRDFCRQEWWYCVLHVAMLNEDGTENEDYTDTCGGFEDGHGKRYRDYVMEEAQGMADSLERQLEADIARRLATPCTVWPMPLIARYGSGKAANYDPARL
jgi:hypothetical protein